MTALVAALISFSAHADDLMQVYDQALAADPIYAQAQSTWESQKMNLPIAKSAYLPQVAVTGNTNRQYTLVQPNLSPNQPLGGAAGATAASSYTWQYGYGINLTQPVFNFVAWSSIKNADATVKAATASYLAAQQSLIQRTATAYFAVLQAYERLRYTVANKRAVWQQFSTAREQFRVGLIAATDEYDARSRYDQVVASQIEAQNNLNIQLENLHAITGRSYTALKGVGKQLPLLSPQPDNVDRWVSVALQQNYNIKAQNYTVISAMQLIKQQQAGAYPAVNLTGGYSDTHIVGSPPDTAQQAANLGLALSYNPIQGGYVDATTEQARDNYVTASGKLEQVHRSVVNQTRSSFLSVLSNISKVKADKQSIMSARNALASTQAGLHVGTRTMVDVLRDLTSLYLAQQQYANDQYDYINNLINLKAAAGTLSVDDIKQINSWLSKTASFPEQLSVANVPTAIGDATVKTDDLQAKQLPDTSVDSSVKSTTTHSDATVKTDEVKAKPLPNPPAVSVDSSTHSDVVVEPNFKVVKPITESALPKPKSQAPLATLAPPSQMMLPPPK
jgi:outer membrane protein